MRAVQAVEAVRAPSAGVSTSAAPAALGAPVAMAAGHDPRLRTAPSSGPGSAFGPGSASGPAPGTLPPPDSGALRAALDGLAQPRASGAQLRVSGSAGRWYGTSGVADPRTGRPVGLNDRVSACGVAGVFVATVALQLAGEGRLRLESPVRHYLPGLLPAGFGAVTVAQLLDHTSGLPAHVGLPELTTQEPTAPELRAPGAAEPAFTPGTRQEYSAANDALAALVVEQVTGQPYGAGIHERVLRPLRLRQTAFPAAEGAAHARQLPGHREGAEGPDGAGGAGGTWPGTPRPADSAPGDPGPGGSRPGRGIVSTTGDLHRFLAALFSGALLPERQLRQMFTLPPAHVRMRDGSPARYSAGLRTATAGGVTFWGASGEQDGHATGMFATRDQQRLLVWSFGPARQGDAPPPLGRIVRAAASRHVIR